MAILCGLIALGLMVAVRCSSTSGWRWWFAGCALLNLLAAWDMVASGFEYAWKLMPPL